MPAGAATLASCQLTLSRLLSVIRTFPSLLSPCRIVDKINSAIGQDPNRVAIIGVLDIYGFEHFKVNRCVHGLSDRVVL